MHPPLCPLLLLYALGGIAIAPSARSQDRDADAPATIAWREHFEQTLFEASEQNLPVFVALAGDCEPSCREMALTHYTDPRLIELLAKIPCFIASPDSHEPAEIDGRVVCSRYGTITCAEHRETDQLIRNLLYANRMPVMPTHLLLSVKGEVLDMRTFWVPPESLWRWLMRALKKLRPDLLPLKLAEPTDPMIDTSLFDDLRSGDRAQREHAAQAFDALDADAVDRVLTTHASSLEPRQRLQLLRHLGASTMSSAAFLLSRQGESFDPVLRRGSAEGFTLLNTPQPLGILLDRLGTESDGEAKRALITAVARCGSKNPAALSTVLTLVNSPELPVKITVLLALSEFAPTPETTTALMRNLDTTDRQLASAATWSAGKARLKEARPSIETLMTRFPELKFQLLAELALKRIRGDSVDEQFYAEQRPIEEPKLGDRR